MFEILQGKLTSPHTFYLLSHGTTVFGGMFWLWGLYIVYFQDCFFPSPVGEDLLICKSTCTAISCLCWLQPHFTNQFLGLSTTKPAMNNSGVAPTILLFLQIKNKIFRDFPQVLISASPTCVEVLVLTERVFGVRVQEVRLNEATRMGPQSSKNDGHIRKGRLSLV